MGSFRAALGIPTHAHQSGRCQRPHRSHLRSAAYTRHSSERASATPPGAWGACWACRCCQRSSPRHRTRQTTWRPRRWCSDLALLGDVPAVAVRALDLHVRRQGRRRGGHAGHSTGGRDSAGHTRSVVVRQCELTDLSKQTTPSDARRRNQSGTAAPPNRARLQQGLRPTRFVALSKSCRTTSPRNRQSVLGGMLDVVDDEDVNGSTHRFEL
jgi:hypothetical protein